MTEHVHNWEVHEKPDKLRCARHGCNTVSTIKVAIANAEGRAAHDMKVTLLTKQLEKRVLKKPAHDTAYAWVMANGGGGELTRQGALL
ncbi:hypothetical protein [Mycobacteroides abscessus]|uniref:hypothetical protein n=1 Tax=Mycobacteroides abscessus TaxID=36809 RepID=UPI0009269336|nr:hypothetical protein [Mycobacteroides abscessus]SIC59410.1 Uncharacterised protein [Mycobacteroides abscessus subsp. abscessus]